MKTLLMVLSLALPFAAPAGPAVQINQLKIFHSDESVIQLNDNSSLNSAAAATTALAAFKVKCGQLKFVINVTQDSFGIN